MLVQLSDPHGLVRCQPLDPMQKTLWRYATIKRSLNTNPCYEGYSFIFSFWATTCGLHSLISLASVSAKSIQTEHQLSSTTLTRLRPTLKKQKSFEGLACGTSSE